MPFCSALRIASRITCSWSSSLSLSSAIRMGVGIGDLHLAPLGAAAERLAQHVAQIEHAHLGARHARDVEGRQRAEPVSCDLDLDLAVGERAVAQVAAELLARVAARRGADERVEDAVLGIALGLGLDLPAQPLARHLHRDLDEVAHDALDVAADIADLGELGGLDLDERGLGQAWRGASRSRSCRSRWARSSRCSWAAPPRGAARPAAGGASGSCSAIATARLAAPWPTMKRSSSETISRGVRAVMMPRSSRALSRCWCRRRSRRRSPWPCARSSRPSRPSTSSSARAAASA